MNTLQIQVQSVEQFDVVIVGGGTTGTFAAIASARAGAKTALVEASGFLGGVAACGLPWMAFHNYEERERIIGGIPYEVIERLRKVNGASDFLMDPILESTVYVNPSLLKIVLMEMAREAGVKLFLHALAGEVRMEGSRVTGVFIHNRQGCQLLEGKAFVDCTDCCNLAGFAGAPVARGRQSDGKVQVASTIFTVGDVDVDAMIRYFEEHPTQLRPHTLPPEELRFVIDSLKGAPLFSLGAFRDLIAEATGDGLRFPRETMIGIVRPCQREIMLVTPRVEDVDPTDEESFTCAEETGYAQILDIMRFINGYMPGGRNARIISTGHTIGMRETSHIVGEYTMTQEDIVTGARFPDAIAQGAYYMDIHTPDNRGLAPMVQPPTYQIPYRCLLPQRIEGLLVAGRCVSATHEALAAIRVIPIAGAMGQAAGTAAAMAAVRDLPVRRVDPSILRAQLEKDGVMIGRGEPL